MKLKKKLKEWLYFFVGPVELEWWKKNSHFDEKYVQSSLSFFYTAKYRAWIFHIHLYLCEWMTNAKLMSSCVTIRGYALWITQGQVYIPMLYQSAGKQSVEYDYLILYFAQFFEHLQDMRRLFKQLLVFGLRVNIEKLNFFCQKKMKFQGHFVTKQGLLLDSGAAQAISKKLSSQCELTALLSSRLHMVLSITYLTLQLSSRLPLIKSAAWTWVIEFKNSIKVLMIFPYQSYHL